MIRTSASFKILQMDQMLPCIKGSPPVKMTSETFRSIRSCLCFSISRGESSSSSRFDFQTSHIKQRQLHRLCGLSTIVEIDSRRLVTRFELRAFLSSGVVEIIPLGLFGKLQGRHDVHFSEDRERAPLVASNLTYFRLLREAPLASLTRNVTFRKLIGAIDPTSSQFAGDDKSFQTYF